MQSAPQVAPQLTPEQVALLEAVAAGSAQVTPEQLIRFAEESAALAAGLIVWMQPGSWWI